MSQEYIYIEIVHVVQRVVDNSRMAQNSDYFIVCSFIINRTFQYDLMMQTPVKRIMWRGT